MKSMLLHASFLYSLNKISIDMRKHLLSLAVMLTVCTAMVNAQNYKMYDFSNYEWEDEYGDIYDSMWGIFYKASANGRYAVGADTMYGSGVCFLWSVFEPDDLTIINNTLLRVSLADVSDEGVIVGSFEVPNPEDPEALGVCYPGWRTADSEWHQLPVPDNFSEYYATAQEYIEEARAITPDGMYIAGNMHITQGYKENPIFGTVESAYVLPCLWTKKADGYELTKVYDELYKNSKVYKDGAFVDGPDSVTVQTFMVYDISDDGNTIVGVNTAGTGGQNPAVIRNGQLYQIFDCGEEEYADELKNFNGGVCNHIDKQGNVYGYYQLNDKSVKFFTLTSNDELVYHDEFIVCTTADGKEIPQSFNGLPYTMSCSDDGSLVVGGSLVSVGFGSVNAPALLWDEESSTSIQRPDAEDINVDVDFRGGQLFVNGLYKNATVYDAMGREVAAGGQGRSFNLASQPSGVYIVKVDTKEGTRTFKIGN